MSSYDLAESSAARRRYDESLGHQARPGDEWRPVLAGAPTKKGIYDTLAGCKTQKRRDAVAAAYKERTGEELKRGAGK